jgi:hypothetical protein
MSKHMVDITLHIDEDIDAETRAGLADRLRAIPGVMAASSHHTQPHLMIVEYDPEELSSREILDTVLETGVHAELIGL